MSENGHGNGHGHVSFFSKYVFSTDHKVIGIQFLFSGLIFIFLGGGLAVLLRIQLAWPNSDIPILSSLFPDSWGRKMAPEFYNMLFSMHATVMIFFVIIPWLTGAFGNFLIPLMIGARDMAFPKLNMLSYWFMWPAFIFLLASFASAGLAGGAGWTSYPTLSTINFAAPNSNMGQVFWLLSLTFVGVSSMAGSVNYITTIINMRAPGMTMMRMPLTIWAMFITAILQAMALPVLTVAIIMQTLDKAIGTTFFLPPGGLVFGNWATDLGGGQPLMWQHLFWFYSHPAVYIMILPAMGMVSDIIATFARKPLFGYKPMVYSMTGIAGLGFIVWGHHMFQSGMDPRLGTGFMIATIMIALPSAVKTFNWLATVWGSNIRFTTAMLFALGFVSMFVIGGLSGIFMAATPVDVYMHDTYYIVAHIHYVLFMSSIFGIFGAIYYWFPKMFGRKLNETWGKVHFTLTFLFANATFFPMHVIGLAGHPRRYADPTLYDWLAPIQPLNVFMTVSAMLLGVSQIVLVVNFFISLFRGEQVERNPWESNSLEWATVSPPPHGNFETVPVTYRGPYEYGALAEGPDFQPQFDPSRAGEQVPVHAH